MAASASGVPGVASATTIAASSAASFSSLPGTFKASIASIVSAAYSTAAIFSASLSGVPSVFDIKIASFASDEPGVKPFELRTSTTASRFA